MESIGKGRREKIKKRKGNQMKAVQEQKKNKSKKKKIGKVR